MAQRNSFINGIGLTEANLLLIHLLNNVSLLRHETWIVYSYIKNKTYNTYNHTK